MKTFYFIAVFLFSSLFLFGQKSDSGKVQTTVPAAEYFSENDFFPNNSSYTSTDTSLDNNQKYFPNNFPYGLGLANRKLLFELPAETGFRSGLEELNLFGYNRNEIKYYNTRTPYTEIMAVFGQKKEQYARLLHTQNITKQWNIAVNMLRMHSEGFYNRQNCSDNNLSLSTNYASKNNRYSFFANGIINSIKSDENGGLRNDTIFENNLFVNKKLIAVNLLNARTRRGSREFTVSQFLNFGKRDSAARHESTRIDYGDCKVHIAHTLNVKENWFVYDDKNPLSNYYENVFNDSSETLDSTHISKIENSFSFKENYWQSGITVKNILTNVKSTSDTTLSNYFLDGSFFGNLFQGSYCFEGASKGDYSASLGGDLSITREFWCYLLFNISEKSPEYIFSRYSSNNFFWRNDFSKTLFKQVELKFGNKFKSGGTFNRIYNLAYFDSTFLPVQYNKALTVYSAFFEKTFKLKKFRFYNKITYQHISNDSILHLPVFVSNHSLYYEGNWFKSAAHVQLGFDVTYFSSYYADAYMPALGLYYLQYEKKIGNYPYIDFFLSMKVKHARIFFKTEHLNSGLMGGYYLAPHNPAPDRSIKVGINWVFYD